MVPFCSYNASQYKKQKGAIFFMNEYVLYFFAVIVFFILIRETIIDIKTMYVPDNITYAIYSIAMLFWLVSWIATGSFQTIKAGIGGFLCGFGIPFAISYLAYLIAKFRRYLKRKKQGQTEMTQEESDSQEVAEIMAEQENSTVSPRVYRMKQILFWLFCYGFVALISFKQSVLPTYLFLSVSFVALTAGFLLFQKTKKIDYPIYCVGLSLLIIFLLIKKEPYLLLIAVAAILFEWILARLFKRYYKIEEEEEEDEEAIEGGIGGGDILIFGALGLIYGVSGIITILIYAVFAQLFVILAYMLLSKNKNAFGHVPFVPGIAIGFFIFAMGLDFIGFQEVLFFLWGV